MRVVCGVVCVALLVDSARRLSAIRHGDSLSVLSFPLSPGKLIAVEGSHLISCMLDVSDAMRAECTTAALINDGWVDKRNGMDGWTVGRLYGSQETMRRLTIECHMAHTRTTPT